MNLLEFTNNDYENLYDFMKPLWMETYEPIIGKKQVEFLLEKYFIRENIHSFLDKGYRYFNILDNDDIKGVLVYYITDTYVYLDKLYLKNEERGKGYPKFVFDKLLEIKGKIILNVNQANLRAYYCYLKNGFKVLEEEHIDLGNGMINIDYKMIKEEK